MSKVELLVNDLSCLKNVKTLVENNGGFVKPIRAENGVKIVKTSFHIADETVQQILDKFENVKAREYTETCTEDLDRVSKFVLRYLSENGFSADTCNELLGHLPLRYTLYHPLVLFNNSSDRSFLHGSWKAALQKPEAASFFKAMLEELFPTYTHVATNMPIVEYDVMRRPFHLIALEGKLFTGETCEQTWSEPSNDDFTKSLWCHVVQNGIHQVWSPAFTMFSRGNIKEKKRILDTFPEIEGNDVVDLYAGIGYFTLSYLKKSARRVFCFELNPWSTEGLRRGVALNKFPGECYIFQESNTNCLARLAPFSNLQIRHINLGLLPSSVQGYPLALAIIRNHSKLRLTTLHIHENVHTRDLSNGHFIDLTLGRLQEISPDFNYCAKHLEKIKTFAPDVWHVCLDVDVEVKDR